MTTKLFHISDVHFGVEDQSALAKLEHAVHEETPDALICTGDVTQRATHAQYEAAAQWFGRFDLPVWIDPGNHDMPYANLFERFTRPYQRHNQLRYRVGVSHFESDDLVLVPLKSTVRAQSRWPWSDGVVTQNALERTLAKLETLKEDPRTIIVTAHHPLHGPVENGPSDTIGGNEALKHLVGTGANAVLSGHIHKPFDECRSLASGSVQLIGAGTLSTRLRHNAPPSYNVLSCDKGAKAIKVETRKIAD